MQEKEMSLKQKWITIGGAIVIMGGVVAYLVHTAPKNKATQPKENQTPKTSQFSNVDYAFIAIVYQSKRDDDEFIVRFRNDSGNEDFHRAKPIRTAKSGDGVLAELERGEAWTEYGTSLCTKVLRSLNKNKILQPGDMLYDLEPIPAIDKDVLNEDYDIKAGYGTGHNLFGEAKNITDIVNQK